MSDDKKVKKASFHRAYILQDGARRDPGEQPWLELLTSIAEKSIVDRTVDELIFEPTSLERGALLGMHRPINPDFMSRISSTDGKIADFLSTAVDSGEDGAAPERFANSTAVCFLPVGNVFAVSLGNTNAPRANNVASFLKEFLPPESPTAFWKTEPVVDDDEIRKLKEAKGLIEFSSRFSTARNLFSIDDSDSGIHAYAERMAAYIGGDIELSIEVKLAPSARSSTTKTKFLNLFKKDLPKLTGKNSGAKAKALMSEGVEEHLALVEHNLAEEFEISRLASESHQFSELLHALGDVSGEMETKVRQILEGGDSEQTT